MNHTTVMNGNGAGRPRQIFDRSTIDAFSVFVAETADPLILSIVLIEEFALVASGDDTERPLIIAHIMQINAYGERAVIRVWPVGDVLMPLDLPRHLMPI